MFFSFTEYTVLAAENFIFANSGVYESKSRYIVSRRIMSIFCNVATLLDSLPPHITK